jgi:hypothetical protein
LSAYHTHDDSGDDYVAWMGGTSLAKRIAEIHILLELINSRFPIRSMMSFSIMMQNSLGGIFLNLSNLTIFYFSGIY